MSSDDESTKNLDDKAEMALKLGVRPKAPSPLPGRVSSLLPALDPNSERVRRMKDPENRKKAYAGLAEALSQLPKRGAKSQPAARPARFGGWSVALAILFAFVLGGVVSWEAVHIIAHR